MGGMDDGSSVVTGGKVSAAAWARPSQRAVRSTSRLTRGTPPWKMTLTLTRPVTPVASPRRRASRTMTSALEAAGRAASWPTRVWLVRSGHHRHDLEHIPSSWCRGRTMRVLARRLGLSEQQVVPADEMSAFSVSVASIDEAWTPPAGAQAELVEGMAAPRTISRMRPTGTLIATMTCGQTTSRRRAMPMRARSGSCRRAVDKYQSRRDAMFDVRERKERQTTYPSSTSRAPWSSRTRTTRWVRDGAS